MDKVLMLEILILRRCLGLGLVFGFMGLMT